MMMSSNPEDSEGISTFSKLNSLCTAMERAIRTHSTKHNVDKELLSVRQASFREPAPEAEYATRLFAKFVEDTSTHKSSRDIGNRTVFEMMTIPPVFLDGSGEQLVGKSATSKNIFWLRLVNASLALGSFVILSLVPHVYNTIVKPNDIFTADCHYRNHIIGSFDYTAFQFTLSVSMLVCVYSISVIVFYFLPINEDDHKYIPGLGPCLRGTGANPDQIDVIGRRIGRCLLRESKAVEAALDFVFWMLTSIAGIFSAVTLEQARPFQLGSTGLPTGSETTVTDDDLPPPLLFLSPASFYATFHRTVPSCANESAISLIRAAVALLFLCVVSGALTIQVSVSSFRKERSLRAGRRASKDGPQISSTGSVQVSGDYIPISAGDGVNEGGEGAAYDAQKSEGDDDVSHIVERDESYLNASVDVDVDMADDGSGRRTGDMSHENI